MIIPQCCEYAKTYITLRYEDAEIYDQDFLLNTPPYWKVRGCEMKEFKNPSAVRYDEIKVCPSCEEKMPDIQLVFQLPEKFTIIEDGGYYCSTCNERLDSCQCTNPLEMWQLANNKK